MPTHFQNKSLRVAALAVCATVAGCADEQPNLLDGVPSIAYLQRTPMETGNVFDYTSGAKGADIWTLTPPTASGVRKNLTNWGEGGDIQSFDVSFDGRELLFSGRAADDNNFHVYRINVDGTNPCDAAAGKVTQGACQVTDGPFDQVYPIYLPGGRMLFMTNRNVEGTEVPQFRDEYERATTIQFATASIDGSGEQEGHRNVSHRVAPSLMSDGRIIYTEWRHLGMTNDGDLPTINQDLTGVREGYGREGSKITNSTLRAVEVSPGKVVAIGTARDMTYQAGKILLIDLGGPDITQQSEASSKAKDLTPLVPGGKETSFAGVGRYYDAYPIGSDGERFLVSWADGAVQSDILEMAQAKPDFGLYVYNAKTQTRTPIVENLGSWETNARPLVKRNEPPMLMSSFGAQGTNSTLISALNVYNSSLFNIAPGSIYKVRLTEGFSAEEGFPNMFGLTDGDGMSRLGEVDIQPDGSFKALVPANVPVRMELLDAYGMAADNGNGGNAQEPIWMQGGPGEARVCGGCHENRKESIMVKPGGAAVQALGAARLDYEGITRQERKATDLANLTADTIRGVPWQTRAPTATTGENLGIQAIFDRACVDCHDGSAGTANPSYSIMDLTDGTTFTFTFDLRANPITLDFGEMTYTFTTSYVSLVGLGKALEEANIMVTMGEPKKYVNEGSSRTSEVIKMLNPPRRFPAVDMNQRAFSTPVHPMEVGNYNGHDGGDPKYALTADEYYMLILMADNGGQFYSRENAPGANGGY